MSSAQLSELLTELIRPANHAWLGWMSGEGEQRVRLTPYKSVPSWDESEEGVTALRLSDSRTVVVKKLEPLELPLKLATPYEVRAFHYLYEVTPEDLVARGIYRGTVKYATGRDAYLFRVDNTVFPGWALAQKSRTHSDLNVAAREARDGAERCEYSLYVDTASGRVVQEAYRCDRMALTYSYVYFRTPDTADEKAEETAYPATVIANVVDNQAYADAGVEPGARESIMRFSLHDGSWLLDEEVYLPQMGHSVQALPALLTSPGATELLVDYERLPKALD